jgi:hypothetical protein
MKCVFWNIRGLANSPSRLALKRIISTNQPDIILIVEPWMSSHDLPVSWLARQGLKIFAVNNRDSLRPNLWCICSININLTVLHIDDQQVAFSVMENDKVFCISAIYASTCYLKRRALWLKLRELQLQFNLPWCFFGDFNSILGAHEHRGRHNPARTPIDDFQSWTEDNDLVHIPTRGALVTWSNRRSGRNHTERRLDRSVCNHSWL